MSAPTPPQPVFPGGRERAPEATPASCGNPACACSVAPERPYCCRACARASDDAPECPCGHFGCAEPPR